MQQAACSLIPEEQKKLIHLKIGLLLLNNIPVAEQEEKIFELVNQFNIALEFVSSQDIEASSNSDFVGQIHIFTELTN